MDTQTVFQAGNSYVVSIPKHLVKEMGIKTGQKVIVEKVPDMDAFLVTTKSVKHAPKSVQTEFKRWLATFLKEDAELLDELAAR